VEIIESEDKMKGCTGKILIIDLTKGECTIQELPEEIYRKYLGGYGLGAYYIYKHIKPGCDPLGPENILGFTPGLFTGTGAGFSGRYMVCGKSPLTGKGKRTNGEYCNGGWGNANAGGTFGPAIKRAGFDAIFFHGVSDHPVYLLIEEEKTSLEDADFLWGKDTVETEDELKKLYGSNANVACIGEAGERLSLISGIVNDKGRIAARSGLGAVMGSKKLKALCLSGKHQIGYTDTPSLRKINKEFYAHVIETKSDKMGQKMPGIMNYASVLLRMAKVDLAAMAPGDNIGKMIGPQYGLYGTPAGYVLSAQTADAPVKNFKGDAVQDYPFRKAMKLRPQKVSEHMDKHYGCFACPLKCGAILKYDELPYEDKETHRPEYESQAAFGSLICNDDLDILFKANEYMNRVGMDTISAGGTVAYTMEAVERGILKKEDFKCVDFPDGFLPEFGASETLLPLLKLMVTREGIGDKLADGTKVATTYFPGTEEFAINSNGSELGMHDPRTGKAWAQSYIADPTPGRHTAANYDNMINGMGGFYPAFKPYIEQADQLFEIGRASTQGIKIHQVLESLGLCIFAYFFGDYHLDDLLKAVTGWDMDVEEIVQTGWRIQTLRQMFNAREGAIRHELPQRAIGSPPLKKGASADKSVDAELMVQGYYKGMGYQQDGVPTEGTLRGCGLDDLIPDLANCTGAPERLINEYLVSGPVGKHEKHKPAIGG